MLGQEPHDLRQLCLERTGEIGTRFEKVLEVGCGEGQHLAGAVHPQEVGPLAGPRHVHPFGEIVEFLLRALREQVVRNPDGQLAPFVQLVNHAVVIRIILKTAARIDGTGESEAVHLSHEVTRRICLMFNRQFRSLREGCVQNHRVGPGDEQTGWISLLVALNVAGRRIGRVLRVAARPQGRCVEHRAVVEVQHKHGRVGRDVVNLFERRHSAFGELELGPSANDPYPLRWRSPPGLLLEHSQRVGQRRDPVPAQLHVVVEAAANQMQMGIVEAGDQPAMPCIDHARLGTAQFEDIRIVADGGEAAVLDGDRLCLRLHGIKSGHKAVVKNRDPVPSTLLLSPVAARNRCRRRPQTLEIFDLAIRHATPCTPAKLACFAHRERVFDVLSLSRVRDGRTRGLTETDAYFLDSLTTSCAF